MLTCKRTPPSTCQIPFKQNFTEKSRCSFGHWKWVIIFKQPVKLELTSSGHYFVGVRDERNPDQSEVTFSVWQNTRQQRKNTKFCRDYTIWTCHSWKTVKKYRPAQVIMIMHATHFSRTLLKTVRHASDTANKNKGWSWKCDICMTWTTSHSLVQGTLSPLGIPGR